MRVVIVEDEPLIAWMIEDVVLAMGWRVVGPATTLAEALRLAGLEGIDCAVLDVNLHGVSIYPVAEILADRGIPLLFATGYGSSALPDRFLTEGRLDKPYSPEQLESELLLLAKRSRMRCV